MLSSFTIGSIGSLFLNPATKTKCIVSVRKRKCKPIPLESYLGPALSNG